jgi:hypothetical protein
MFKGYCHISCLIQCYTILQPLNPINLIKKKISFSKPRARAKSRSILLQSKSILPISPFPGPPKSFFILPQPGLELCSIIQINPLVLAPTRPTGSHLASALTFSFSHFVQTTRLAPQTTRCAQTIK